jgi:multidrug efflux pump subunit AcrB
MSHKSEAEYIAQTHNTARFFVENRQLSLVILIAVCVWGWYGFQHMPKRKDPKIPVRVAVASTQWPGATAQEVEQLLTRQIEQTMAQNAFLKPPSASDFSIRSFSFPALSMVYVQLDDQVTDPKKQFTDMNLKLNALNATLPQGAGPIQFNSDFGDTAALMLTVASPPANEVDVALRARSIQNAIEKVRAAESKRSPKPRVSIVNAFPLSVSAPLVRDSITSLIQYAVQTGMISDPQFFEGSGFIGVDVGTRLTDDELRKDRDRLILEKLHRSEVHPDAWPAALIRNPEDSEARLAAVAGDKYSYRELDDFTDLISRTILGATAVAKIDRKGVLPEQIYLDYSQDRLAQYGVTPSKLKDILAARNSTLPGGQLEVGASSIQINPSGKFTDPQQIGEVIVGSSSSAAQSPVYLRDLVDISRGYQSAPRYLNYLIWADKQGIGTVAAP